MNINGKYMSEPEVQAYINELEDKLSETEDKHLNECRQISAYEAENRTMKGILHDTLDVLDAAFYANKNDKAAADELYEKIKTFEREAENGGC